MKTVKKEELIEGIPDDMSVETLSSLHGVKGAFQKCDNDVWYDCIFSFYNERLFACQNEIDGAECSTKWGMRHSWVLSHERIRYTSNKTSFTRNEMSRRLADALTRGEYVKGLSIDLNLPFVVDCNHRNISFLSLGKLTGHHFDLRKGEISYCPSNKEQKINPDGTWNRENRATIKTGKFIMMLLQKGAVNIQIDGDTFKFSELDPKYKPYLTTFCEIKSGIIKSTAFEDCILVSDDPSSIYEMETSRDTGSLDDSCMRPESSHGCRHGAEWYTYVGLKIAYIQNPINKNLVARALLWENCYFVRKGTGERILSREPFTFVDRIYGNDAAIGLFTEWAKEKGYYHRAAQNSREHTLISPDGIPTDTPFVWDKRIEGLSDVSPYMDTMRLINCKTRMIGCGGAWDTSDSEFFIGVDCSSGDAFEDVQVCPHCDAFARHVVPTGERVHIFRDATIEYWNDEGSFIVIRKANAVHLNLASVFVPRYGIGLIQVLENVTIDVPQMVAEEV